MYTLSLHDALPIFGDIPILGQLFRSKSINQLNSELVVIVTPSIVDPAAAPGPAPEVPKTPINPLDQKQFDQKTPSGNRSEEHTSELQSLTNLVCRLLLEK